MSNLSVQRMAEADWERVRAVRLRALTDSPDAFATLLSDERRRPPESWRARLADPSAATFLAVDEVGAEWQDVGLVVGAPFEGREPSAGLFAMWVAPEARGRGAGDLLVEAVIAWARDEGYPHLLLEVADDNVPAIRLYQRHGFAPTGVATHFPEPREHICEHERIKRLS